MDRIHITLKGIAAELTLGNYMPGDATIFNNWEDFYHFKDIIHCAQLMTEYISEIEIKQNDELIFTGKIPGSQLKSSKSFLPVMKQKGLYLRTECAEEAVFQCEFEAGHFDKMKLFFETQDFNSLFKVGNSFIQRIHYDQQVVELEWVKGKPVGNICVLCRYENGYLIPLFDAINKKGVI